VQSATTVTSQYAKNLIRGASKDALKTSGTQKTYKPPANFTPSDTSNLEEDMKVEHPKFGFGKVIEIDNSGTSRKAKVEFDNFGEKTLLLSFAKLKIH